MSATRTLILALKADASDYTQNMALAKKETENAKKELALFAEKNNLAKNSITYMARELKTSKESQQVLAKEIALTNQQLKLQIDKYGESSKEAQTYRGKLTDLELAEAKLNNAIKSRPKDIFNSILNSTANAGKSISGFGDKLTTGVSVPIIGATVGVMSTALNNADEMQILADKTGLTTERIQELRYAATKLDVELETITSSQAKFTKAMFSANDSSSAQAKSFKALGISVKDSNGALKDNRDLMFETFTALGQVQSETYRDIIAMNLFGKSALELNPLIKAGGAELSKLSQEAHDMGAVLSDSKIKSLDTLGDGIESLKWSAISLATELGLSLIPLIDSFLQSLKGLIPYIRTAIENFNALPESTKKSIFTFGAVAIAAGPAIGIFGRLTTLTSKLVMGASGLTAFATGIGQICSAISLGMTAAASSTGSFLGAFMLGMGPAGWVVLGTGVILAATAAIWKMNSATDAHKVTIKDLVPVLGIETTAISNQIAATDAAVASKLKLIQTNAMLAGLNAPKLQEQYDTASYSEMILQKAANNTINNDEVNWLSKNDNETYRKLYFPNAKDPVTGLSFGKISNFDTNLIDAMVDKVKTQSDTLTKLQEGWKAKEMAEFIANGGVLNGNNVKTPVNPITGGLSAAEIAAILADDEKIPKVKDTQAEALKQMASALDSYKKSLDSAIESAIKFVGTFDKFEIKSQSLSSMIRNMGKNFATMRDYLSNMKLIENRGLSRGLIADLYDKGVSSAGEVKRLAGATDEQIATINTIRADEEYLAGQIGYRKLSSKESVTNYVTNINGKTFNDNDLVQKIFDLLASYNIQLAN